MHDTNDRACPENRLWMAVLIAAITEYEDLCVRIESSWNREQRPVNPAYRYALERIRQECDTAWFRAVCDMANVPRATVMRKLDQLDKDHCVRAIPYADQPPPTLSDWQRRKLRNKNKLLKYSGANMKHIQRLSRDGCVPVERVKSDTQLALYDEKQPGEGLLVLDLNDDNYIQIDGDIRIHLNFIKCTSGLNRAVRLTIIAPKMVPIERMPKGLP